METLKYILNQERCKIIDYTLTADSVSISLYKPSPNDSKCTRRYKKVKKLRYQKKNKTKIFRHIARFKDWHMNIRNDIEDTTFNQSIWVEYQETGLVEIEIKKILN